MKHEAIRYLGVRNCGIAPGLALALLLGSCVFERGALAGSGEAAFHFDVPRGQWRGARVKDIPEGAKLSVEIVSDGPVAVLLLDASDFERFPEPERPVFRGRTSEKLSFSVLAPTTSDYFLLVDNREGSGARSIDVSVRGETAEPATSEPAA
jgi:hypothetical protein